MTTATKYKTYSKYKPSGIDWLGDIPAEWEVKRLKYGFYFTKGKNAALYTAEYNAEHAGDYPVYSGQTEGEGVMGSIDSYDYAFERVIFTTTVGAKVMTPLLLSGKFSLSQNCLLMIKSSKQVYEKYFYYQLFPLFNREKSLVPSHMQPSLRFSDLNTFNVAYPEITEQKEIADFLDHETAKIDEMVAKKQKMIDLLKEKRQALITHAVTKGLDPKAKMKPSGIDWLGDIPAGWEVKDLKYLLDRNDGGVWGEDFDDEGTPVLRSTEIDISGEWRLDEFAKRKLTPQEKQKALLKEGDLLITKSSGSELHIGKTALVNKEIDELECCFSNFMQRLRPNKGVSSKLLFYFFNSYIAREQYNYFSQSTTGLANLSEGLFGQIIFVKIPESEQKQIVTFLERETAKIDGMMKKVEMQIEKLQEYRQALITNAVTGKIKV